MILFLEKKEGCIFEDKEELIYVENFGSFEQHVLFKYKIGDGHATQYTWVIRVDPWLFLSLV